MIIYNWFLDSFLVLFFPMINRRNQLSPFMPPQAREKARDRPRESCMLQPTEGNNVPIGFRCRSSVKMVKPTHIGRYGSVPESSEETGYFFTMKLSILQFQLDWSQKINTCLCTVKLLPQCNIFGPRFNTWVALIISYLDDNVFIWIQQAKV